MRCLHLITAIFVFQTTTVFSDSTASEIFIDLSAATKDENPLCDPSEQPKVATIVSDSLQEVQQTTPPSPFSFFFEKSMKAVDNGRQAIANVDWDALSSKGQDITKDFAQAVANINLNKMASDVKQAASTIDIHKFASDVGTKVDDVQQAAAKIDLEKIGSDISQTAQTTFIDIKETISKIDLEKLTTDLTTAAATAFNDIKRSIYAINLSDLPRAVQDWIVKHPYQTAFYVASGIVFLFPGIVTGPILHVLGFTPEGIRFGKNKKKIRYISDSHPLINQPNHLTNIMLFSI